MGGVYPHRGVYHGQEGSAELLDDPVAREEAGVTSRGRIRTQVTSLHAPSVAVPKVLHSLWRARLAGEQPAHSSHAYAKDADRLY